MQFVLKPSFLPSAEFDIDFVPLLRDGKHLYGEIAVVITNVGSNTLVKNVRWIRYLADELPGGSRPRLSEPQFTKMSTPQGEEAFIEELRQPEVTSLPPSDPSTASAPSAPSVAVSEQVAASGHPHYRVWLLLVPERTLSSQACRSVTASHSRWTRGHG